MNTSDIKNKTLEAGATFTDMMVSPPHVPVYDWDYNYDQSKAKNIDIQFNTSKNSFIDAIQTENMMN